jgi:hypothetical protein
MPDLAELRVRLDRITATAVEWGCVSSGLKTLDAVLPEGGFRRGTLVEWLAVNPGAGTTLCAMRAAREVMAADRPLVVVDSDGTFHPPGLGSSLDWSRVLLVRSRELDESLWAADQSLRTSGVGGVLVRLDYEDERRMRRWQLAAEQSGVLGLIVRTLERQPEACFSDLRFMVTPLSTVGGRSLRIEVLRSRQGGNGAVVDVRLDDDAYSLPSTASESRRRRVANS